MPGRLAGALQSGDTAPYRSCLTGDPADNDTVACSEPHWAEEISGLPDVPEGTPYPADQAARAAIAAQCLPDAVDYLDGPCRPVSPSTSPPRTPTTGRLPLPDLRARPGRGRHDHHLVPRLTGSACAVPRLRA